jgi:hypothetical protein
METAAAPMRAMRSDLRKRPRIYIVRQNVTRLTRCARSGTHIAFLRLVHCLVNRDAMAEVLERIERLPDREFRQFEYGLVAYYRRHESEQERIAVALLRRGSSALNTRSRDRIEEILSMLDHVHDPFIR